MVFVRGLQGKGEIFSFVWVAAAAFLDPGHTGDMPNTKREGKAWHRWAVWKWATCEKCHAGIVATFFFPTKWLSLHYFGTAPFHVWFCGISLAVFLAWYGAQRI